MRLKKAKISSRVNNNLGIQFIRQDLTSYSGLELIKRYFRILKLNGTIKAKMKSIGFRGDYPVSKMLLLLIAMIILGVERISNIEYIKDDPLVKRFIELDMLPSRYSIIRFLKQFTGEALKSFIELNSELLVEQINKLGLTRLTIDIDGTVVSSRGKPELSGKGYNPIKRGAYSYFPLTAYLAQTGHFLKIMNRPGNVHDSNGSYEFIEELITGLKFMLGNRIRLQIRHDGAFFSEKNLKMYEKHGLEYASKVPFYRYPIFKRKILSRKKWRRLYSKTSYFFKRMKLDSWEEERLFLFIRIEVPKKKKKKECQLDLFSPDNIDYEYSVICTNSDMKAKNVIKFMSGRSAQEKAIGELKSDFSFDKLPSSSFNANSAFQQVSMMSYNLMNSFQLDALGHKHTVRKNIMVTRWYKNLRFKTIRFLFVYKAGILSRPNGKLTLNLSNNKATRNLYKNVMQNINLAA